MLRIRGTAPKFKSDSLRGNNLKIEPRTSRQGTHAPVGARGTGLRTIEAKIRTVFSTDKRPKVRVCVLPPLTPQGGPVAIRDLSGTDAAYTGEQPGAGKIPGKELPPICTNPATSRCRGAKRSCRDLQKPGGGGYPLSASARVVAGYLEPCRPWASGPGAFGAGPRFSGQPGMGLNSWMN